MQAVLDTELDVNVAWDSRPIRAKKNCEPSLRETMSVEELA